MYRSSQQEKFDYEQSIVYAAELAAEEAEARGKAEGEREKQIAIAKKFKEMGLPLEDISKGTGLSVEEIEKL